MDTDGDIKCLLYFGHIIPVWDHKHRQLDGFWVQRLPRLRSMCTFTHSIRPFLLLLPSNQLCQSHASHSGGHVYCLYSIHRASRLHLVHLNPSLRYIFLRQNSNLQRLHYSILQAIFIHNLHFWLLGNEALIRVPSHDPCHFFCVPLQCRPAKLPDCYHVDHLFHHDRHW
jgi:hypothetical protein